METQNLLSRIQVLLRDYEVLSEGKRCFFLVTKDYIEFNEGVTNEFEQEFILGMRFANLEQLERHLMQEIKKIVSIEKMKEKTNKLRYEVIDVSI